METLLTIATYVMVVPWAFVLAVCFMDVTVRALRFAGKKLGSMLGTTKE